MGLSPGRALRRRLLLLLVAGQLYGGVIAAAVGSSPGQLVMQDDTTTTNSFGSSSGSSAGTQSERRLHGRFLHITDLHPDDFYKLHTSTEEGIACHRGNGPAGTYGAETSDCDSPMSLINATFDWLAANIRDKIDFVVWTGDSARHDSDEDIPRSPAQILGTNRAVAARFKSTFSHPAGDALPIPVIPTFGNNDILPHNILLPGPNQWLSYYTDIWDPFIPEEQRHSFEFGGWFYVEVIPNKLAVFSLNTLYFFDRNAGVDDCVQPSEPGFKQMEWLRVQLGFLRRRGMKAILMGHVPPARTESKMLWDETCWQKYTLWLQQYRDVVVSGIYGHMNIDHFLIQDTKELNIQLLEGKVQNTGSSRVAMDDELSVQGAADYLLELRSRWRKLAHPQDVGTEEEVDDDDDVEADKKKGRKKKGKKGKKPHKKHSWGERYQVTMVGPSIVPNYFPTVRVIEYNITGLENALLWADRPDAETQRKKHKKGGKKGKKGKTPKDPNLIVPDPPAKTAPPGPAYSPQTFSLTGYTQYYANLTYINNDLTPDDGEEVDSFKWKKGKHHGKKPKHKPVEPNPFEFQVEYSTFNDSLYKLDDLTVNSYVELAYRMGQSTAKGKTLSQENDDIADEDGEDIEDDGDEEEYEDGDMLELRDGKKQTGGGKKKHKKKKKKPKHNKVWLHFLRHAFVRTVDEKALKKLDRPL